jgi:methionyl aminopeptidase
MELDYLDTFRENGHRIGNIRQQLVEFAQTHHQMEEVDALAQELIKKAGGEPAFQKVDAYYWATCITVNDGMVHGIPKGSFKPGDIVTIDTGMFYQGTTTDCSTTFVIGAATPEQEHFLSVGKHALKKAIKQAKSNNQVKDISKAMQTNVEAAGFNVVRTLTGHGLGKTMHENPQIPCFVSSDKGLRTRLKPGMVLAIEVMYMQGDWPLKLAKDGWTLTTADGSLSGMFEEDVIVTPQGPEIITQPTLFDL